MRTLMRDLHTVIPNSYRTNRGKMGIKDLAELALNLKAKHVLVVNRWKGGPGKIEFYRVLKDKLEPIPPILYVKGVRLQREYKIFWRKLRIRCRSLAIVQPKDVEFKKLAEVLSKVFNAPIVSEGEKENFQVYVRIFKDLNQRTKITFFSSLHKQEIGPSLYLRKVVGFEEEV